jgi:endonuclease-8
MPEGDTIYRTAATLHRALAGRVITRFETAYAHLAVVDDQQPIAGRIVESVTAAGKHLLIRIGDLVLRTHMRMHGSWHIYRPGEAWRRPRSDMRIVIETDEWIAVAFNVPVAEFVSQAAIPHHEPLATLGPDLLAPVFDERDAMQRLRTRAHEPIQEVLLNQRLVAGIGNVYKSETLFLAGVHPETPVAALDDRTLAALLGHARRLMRANVTATSPTAIVTYGGFRRPGERGAGLWVYGRGGLPCRRCGTAILYRKSGLNARGTYWCPQCQRSNYPPTPPP